MDVLRSGFITHLRGENGPDIKQGAIRLFTCQLLQLTMQRTLQHMLNKLVSQKSLGFQYASRCTLSHLLHETHQSEGELLRGLSILHSLSPIPVLSLKMGHFLSRGTKSNLSDTGTLGVEGTGVSDRCVRNHPLIPSSLVTT